MVKPVTCTFPKKKLCIQKNAKEYNTYVLAHTRRNAATKEITGNDGDETEDA